MLTEIDGEIYECQTFLAFEGTKEIERVNNMHAFVDQINAVYGDITADKIPEIMNCSHRTMWITHSEEKMMRIL